MITIPASVDGNVKFNFVGGKVMKKDRRDFLKTSAKFMGVLTAFGLTGSTAYADTTTSPLQAPGATPAGPGALPQRSIPAKNLDALPVKSMPARPASPAVTTLNNVITDALATKDMGKTLPKFKGQLTPQQFGALQKLTPQDLAQLQTLKNKLGPAASGDTGGDRGGIFW
jgi:hypothetical protein